MSPIPNVSQAGFESDMFSPGSFIHFIRSVFTCLRTGNLLLKNLILNICLEETGSFSLLVAVRVASERPNAAESAPMLNSETNRSHNRARLLPLRPLRRRARVF